MTLIFFREFLLVFRKITASQYLDRIIDRLAIVNHRRDDFTAIKFSASVFSATEACVESDQTFEKRRSIYQWILWSMRNTKRFEERFEMK